jgi:hypothetical protein
MATIEYDIKVNDEGAVKSLGQLEAELAQINEELADVPVGSKAFKDLTKQSQALNRELEEINNEIDGFKFEDKIQAADGAAKVFAGSLSAAVGTLGALGVESEAFGEFEQKAASAIAVGLGIKDVSEGFSQVALAAKKSGIATKLFGTTTKRALIATGVGAFVVALGTVVAYWDDISKAARRFADNVPFIGNAVEGVKKAFNALFDAARPVLEFLGILPDEEERAAIAIEKSNNALVQSLQRDLAIAQAAGEEAKKIYDIRKQLIETELELLKNANAEKEEIYAKETELLALNAAEQKRIADERSEYVQRDKVETVSSIQAKGLAEIQLADITENVLKPALVTEQILTAQQIADREAYTVAVVENEKKLVAAKQQTLDNLIALAGAETAMGRALIIAKQIQSAKELFLEAKKTITFASLKGAEATAATATGAAKTAAVGFPQNIPLLIAYAVQAAGIISTVVSAVKGAKSAASSVPGAGGAPTPAPVRVPTGRGAAAPTNIDLGQAPEVAAQQQSVRAYVVGGDVTSEQEATAKLNAKRKLG